ncbi:MAG: hypothetical protein R3C40_07600 [Parvularculaceae bacterium]
MAVYAFIILHEVDPSVLGHIIVASIISVPAAIVMAQVMMPGTARRHRRQPMWRMILNT